MILNMQANIQQYYPIFFILFMKAIFPGSDTHLTQVGDMDVWFDHGLPCCVKNMARGT